jgi:ADP-ribosylation factor GTPase-activating protein 2/3
MQVGGNTNATSFFQQHNCTSKDAQQKYNSRAATLYKEKLLQSAQNTMRVHGTTLHLDHLTPAPARKSESEESTDFFDRHKDDAEEAVTRTVNDLSELSSKRAVVETAHPTEGPSLSAVSAKPQEVAYKSVMNSRKPAAKKGGLGGKKRLGAQKVTADFDKLEEDALKADEEKKFAQVDSKPLTEEEQHDQMKTMEEAYVDLSERQKIIEQKMRYTDPSKAEHFDRLGMGFNIASTDRKRGAISHSAVSDMKNLSEQSNPSSRETRDRDRETSSRSAMQHMERDLLLLELGLSTGQPKTSYSKDSPFGRSDNWSSETKGDEDNFWDAYEDKKSRPKPQVIESIPSLDDDKPARGRRNVASASSTPSSNDAQKKFGAAKAISSDQFFGNQESSFEQRTTLTRFENSASISSDDYFGRETQRPRGGAASYASSAIGNANMYDIKEGVKDGVSKVAGRLSSMASDAMSSLQEKYGY